MVAQIGVCGKGENVCCVTQKGYVYSSQRNLVNQVQIMARFFSGISHQIFESKPGFHIFLSWFRISGINVAIARGEKRNWWSFNRPTVHLIPRLLSMRSKWITIRATSKRVWIIWPARASECHLPRFCNLTFVTEIIEKGLRVVVIDNIYIIYMFWGGETESFFYQEWQ